MEDLEKERKSGLCGPLFSHFRKGGIKLIGASQSDRWKQMSAQEATGGLDSSFGLSFLGDRYSSGLSSSRGENATRWLPFILRAPRLPRVSLIYLFSKEAVSYSTCLNTSPRLSSQLFPFSFYFVNRNYQLHASAYQPSVCALDSTIL